MTHACTKADCVGPIEEADAPRLGMPRTSTCAGPLVR